eukprot:Phypoly_transcript_03922.p1 GENE.Phypoly_transcript_03922~~Phypoly_transcript_03922.p1  ORF type:complete len:658 (+),score=80.30 Phypoly_transcript_03922:101-2074(+)
MSAADTLRLRNRASRRLSQSPSGLQRRESLLANKLSKFSKSLGTIPSLYDSSESISPKLRRCKSEEILPSWDHFSDSSHGLKMRKKTIMPKIETDHVSYDTPQSSPVCSPTKRGKGNTMIILESPSVVTAGTIESLVDHLTDLQFITGTQYMEHFLYTYRYFMTAEQLLVKLGERYACILPTDLTPEEAQNQENLIPLQKLRVINVFKKWVENHVHDFSDVNFLAKFNVFLEEVVNVDNQKWAEHLKKIVDARILKAINEGKASDDMKKFTVKTVKLKNIQSLMTVAALLRRCEIVSKRKKNLRTYKHSFYGNEAIDWITATFQPPSRADAINLANQLLRAGFIRHHNESNNKERTFKDKNSLYVCNASLLSTEPEEEFPKPLRPKTSSFSFLDLHPVEIARQLTLIEFSIFEKITPQELSHQAWNKKNAKELAPNVTALIDRCNEVAYWVATEIVMTPNQKQRISVLAKFIDIAEICYEIRNWNTLMELMVGLNLGCVTRLKKTWEGLPKHATATFENLTKLTSSSSNYTHYREALATKELPFSPNLAVHLRDLTFIEDGNEDTIGDGLVNFTKMHMLGAVFEEIYRLQSARYHFKEIKAMTKYLTQGIYVLRLDKELYKRSTMCEPSVRTMSMMNKTRSGRFLTLTRSSLITKSV